MSSVDLDEADTPHLKSWLMKRLEDISDADTDVLADYVIALVKSDEPDEQIRANCTEQLEDFLHGHQQKFVDDVFGTLHSKSYKPGYKPANQNKALPGLNSGAATFVPQGPSQVAPAPQAAPQGAPGQPYAAGGFPAQSKKRGRDSRDEGELNGFHGQNGERPQKQMRGGRGALNARGGRGGRGGAAYGQQQQPSMAMPQMPQGFPQFDPNNPMASMMAMQAMGFPVPGLEQMQGFQPPPKQQPARRRGRCRDYDNKGFCARGTTCPYEHGSDHIVVPEPYDPANASMALQQQQSPPPFPQQSNRGPSSRGQNTRGRGRGQDQRGRGGGGGRSAFSAAGPNHDRRVTSIVVEQIPEDKFTEDAVRSFFSEFGTMEEVTLQAYKRLAIVRFADYDAANAAYQSPKVIFDNRFVKVYWYKPGGDQLEPATQAAFDGQPFDAANGEKKHPKQDEEMIDPAEFAAKQAEAQRAHEEKQRRLKEAEDAKNELEKKVKAQAEERRQLMEKLATKTRRKSATPGAAAANGATSANGTGSPAPSSREEQKAKATEALRAKLAELEAEAEAMGLPPAGEESSYQPYPYGAAHGHGAYPPRGRGGFRGRGRGRGGFGAPSWQGGSVARLDNRPKIVSVQVLDEGVDLADDGTGEALRAFLYGVGSFASLTPPEAGEDGAGVQKMTHVAFHERYVAENFMASVKHAGESIPGLGKVELGWIANPPVVAAPPAGVAINGLAREKKEDVEMGAGVEEGEVDYDVADDMEQGWIR